MILGNSLIHLLLFFPMSYFVQSQADWHFDGPNVALHKHATQHPWNYMNKSADLAVDDNTSYGNNLRHCSHTEEAIDPDYAWWSVDLGAPYFLTGIQIYNRDLHYRFRLASSTITGRSAGVNTTIYILKPHDYPRSVIQVHLNGTVAFDTITISLPPHKTNSYLTLCEVKIFAKGCRGIQYDSISTFTQTLTSGHQYNINRDLYNVIGTTIQIRCRQGYTPQSPVYVHCQPDTHYNASIPFCRQIRHYCNLPVLSNGQYGVTPGGWYDNMQQSIRENGSIFVTCKPGFKTNEHQSSTCLPGGEWSEQIPTCQAVTCGNPEALQNVYYTRLSNNSINLQIYHQFPFNTSLRAKCFKGSTLNASHNVITCTSSGDWSSRPVCVEIICRVPALEYGHYRQKDSNVSQVNPLLTITSGDVIQPLCMDLYQVQTSGNSDRTCQADGRLSGGKPICVPLCKIPNFANGVYNNTIGNTLGTVQMGGKIIPKCNPGYTLIGSGGARTCKQDHTWSEQTATCTAKRCIIDKLHLNMERVTSVPVTPTIVFNQTLRLECRNGYERQSGKQTLRCNENEQFDGDPLTCEAKTCEVALLNLDENNVTVIGKLKIVAFNYTLQLECKDGFRSVLGLSALRCKENEHFEGNPLQCKAKGQPESKSQTSPAVIGVVGGSCAALIMVTAIVALVLYRRRRHRLPESKNKKEQMFELSETNARTEYSYANTIETNQLDIEDHVYNTPIDSNVYNTIVENEDERQEHSSHDYNSYTVEKLPTSAMRVRDLADTILIGDNDTFQRQFQSFPTGMHGLHEAAMKTENRGKNKYREMYPYDMTRVVLQPGSLMSETDYINASYINGFSMTKRYIAAQAPFDPSLNDFWRMIWQIDVSKIVMLTNLKEEEKVKCVQYWPNQNSAMYGRVKVTLTKAEQFSDFIIRHFLISKDDASNRSVIQFHFTAWPDKGVPKYACSLVHFRHKAMNTIASTNGPVVVHCSSGVGRTGTFIALDILAEQGKRLQYVDVLGCVQTLRKQRLLMVQTQEQYKFIHLALTEELMLSPSVLPAAKFIDYYETALEINPEAGKTYVNTEFEMLKNMSPTTEESQYISAKEVQNRKKNLHPSILPVEEFIPRLTSESANSYVNAVFLPSYRSKDAFLITQAPMESTKEEFWRLVYDHKVYTIVMMNNVCELDSENEIYWPRGEGVVTFDNLTVSLTETEEEGGHYIMTLEVAVSDKKRQIKLFQYCYQMAETFPGTPESVLTMMELVQYWQQHTGNHPIVVHCMNGVEKSGIYCVISAVIERLKIEQDVAISQTIEVMRNCREQLISSVEQFEFCHEAVSVYIKQFETYSNFSEITI